MAPPPPEKSPREAVAYLGPEGSHGGCSSSPRVMVKVVAVNVVVAVVVVVVSKIPKSRINA